MPNSPDLTLPLAQPITLTRGPRSHLVTLMDAAILIRDLEPFPGAVGVGSRCEMILIATETGEHGARRRRSNCSSVRSGTCWRQGLLVLKQRTFRPRRSNALPPQRRDEA